jgi:hypothetical protein
METCFNCKIQIICGVSEIDKAPRFSTALPWYCEAASMIGKVKEVDMKIFR